MAVTSRLIPIRPGELTGSVLARPQEAQSLIGIGTATSRRYRYPRTWAWTWAWLSRLRLCCWMTTDFDLVGPGICMQ